MLLLVTSLVSLAIGFVLGRVWEIRQGMRQTASDSAHLASAPSDRHDARAQGLTPPRDLLASHNNKSQMGF